MSKLVKLKVIGQMLLMEILMEWMGGLKLSDSRHP